MTSTLRWPLLLMITIFTLCAYATSAAANDAVFGGTATDLVLVQENRLRMASEDIKIVEKKKTKKWGARHWDIHATYTFENPTDKEVSATFGFPEYACDDGGDCNSLEDSKFTFHNMKTSVDGKKVKLKLGKVSDKGPWKEYIGRVHLFDVTVPANKSVKVVHRYQMGSSGSSMMDNWVMYVTKTGAFWNGPIGSAKFTITLLDRPWGFSYPEDYKLKTFTTSAAGDKTTLAFEMKDWTPKQDFNVSLGGNLFSTAGCPSMQMSVWDFYDEGKLNLPAVREAFRGKSVEDVRVCRNLVYAAHGYTFKDKTLHEFFYKYSTPTDIKKIGPFWPYWTIPIVEDGGAKAIVFAPEENYSSDHLTTQELLWVKALKALEKQMKKDKK